MDNLAQIKTIDPDLVLVPGDRIRKVFKNENIAELAESFQRIGQAQPGVCIEVEDKVILVAGERRLRACRLIKMPYRYTVASNTDVDFIREIEIEENLNRSDLTWQEEVSARQELHALLEKRKAKLGGKQTIRETAKALKESVGGVQEVLEVAQFMADFPEVREAKNLSEAKKAVKKLKGIALRQYFLETAAETAKESRARSETAPEKTEAPLSSDLSAETIEVAGFRMTTEKLLDYDKRVILGPMEEQLSHFNDGSISVVLWDPPWGVNYDTVKIENSASETFEDNVEVLTENLGNWLALLYQKMAVDSHLYMFFGIRNYQFIYESLANAGFTHNGLPIYWIKLGVHHTRNPEIWPGRSVEPIAFARKGNKKIVKQGAPDHIITPQANPKMKQIHPAAKHPDVFMELIQRSCLPGDTVLDPMCGSGLSGVAMGVFEQSLKLDWWLIEKEKNFRDLALENCLLGYSQLVAHKLENTFPSDKPSNVGKQYDHLLVKGNGDFKKLLPGTPQWKSYWKDHPESQEEMLAFAKTLS